MAAVRTEQNVGAVFFFFQAEDGIRDYKVTGVQTCALPISKRVGSEIAGAISSRQISPGRIVTPETPPSGMWVTSAELIVTGIAADWTHTMRSEERRVGKECRSRWSPYH